MGHDKLRKFAENEHFSCLLQPAASALLADGYFALRDHEVKGHWAARFGNGGDIVLELGCGKGEYTLDLARRDISRNFIGVDIKGARLWKGAKAATEQALPNVAFLRTRIEFIRAFFAPGEVSGIWLTFPDPQMRKENARLTAPVFLERYRTFLKPGGKVRLKTDSQFLYRYTLALCEANGLAVKVAREDLYGGPRDLEPALYEVQTFYEKMFLEQGYKIYYLEFTRDHEGAIVSPPDFDAQAWRAVEGPRQLFGRDTAETRRQKLRGKAAGLLLLFLCAGFSLRAQERPCSLQAAALYGWNTGFSHYGGVQLLADLPFHRNFEGGACMEALTPGVFGGTVVARPLLPLPVGALFLETGMNVRFFPVWRIWEGNLALRLGYRMDYVHVQCGLHGRMIFDMDHAEGGHPLQEPCNLQYLLAVRLRPATSRWNAGAGVANFDEAACYRTWEPFFFLHGRYDCSAHLRLRTRVAWKPAGMFHMNASLFGVLVRLGLEYSF